MSSHRQTTVMGPGPGAAPNKLFDPPKLTPTSDKLRWRKKVRLWARTLKTLAKGGDPKAVSAVNAMALTLYQSIDDAFGGKLEGAIDAGLIDIEPEEHEDADPMETVQKIIQVVAKDSVIDTVRRDFELLNRIHACKRKIGEVPSVFAHRYECLALRYINNCSHLAAKQLSQNFALILLDNADIPSTVYNGIVTQIVAKANERKDEEDKVIAVCRETVTSVETESEELIKEYLAYKESPTPIPEDDENDGLLRRMYKINKGASKVTKLKTRKDGEERRDVFLTLEDAVQALSDLKIDDIKPSQVNMPDIRVQGAMLGKRSSPDEQSSGEQVGGSKRYKPSNQSGDNPKGKCKLCVVYGTDTCARAKFETDSNLA